MNNFQELINALILPVTFFVVLYLIVFLPQKKREKKKKEMLDAVKVGDNIVTIGGIIGKVINIKDDEVTIETSIDKTKVKVLRSAINSVEEPKES
ncbi:MAG: preprotein translocase subunit YajC [Bacillota bacterium]